jgi:hypothetical protein
MDILMCVFVLATSCRGASWEWEGEGDASENPGLHLRHGMSLALVAFQSCLPVVSTILISSCYGHPLRFRTARKFQYCLSSEQG